MSEFRVGDRVRQLKAGDKVTPNNPTESQGIKRGEVYEVERVIPWPETGFSTVYLKGHPNPNTSNNENWGDVGWFHSEEFDLIEEE